MTKRKQATLEWNNLDWWRNRVDVSKDDGHRIKGMCPSHDDDSPSFAASQIRPNKVVWRCYAGCEQTEVLEAAQGMQSSQSTVEEDPPEPKPSSVSPRKTRTAAGVVVTQSPLDWLAEYTGTDTAHLRALGVVEDDGQLVYTVDGWQNAKVRKPGTKELRWLIKDGQKPPLWPTVPDTVGSQVWITEGETDAIVLQAWGLEAYAMLSGASSPPDVAVFKELADRGAETIVAALDADAAGREGTDKLLAKIAEAGLHSRVARPRTYSPISGTGKDWRDARLNGEHKPTVTVQRKGLSYNSLASRAIQGMDWFVEGLIGRNVMTMMAGLPKAGKSTFVFNMLAAIEAEDTEFLGRSVHQPEDGFAAIYLSEEGPYTVYQKMSGRLKRTLSIELQIDAARENETFLETLSRVAENARQGDVDLLIIDTVSAWAAMEDENSAAEVTEAIQRIRVMTQGLGVMLIHHANKGQGEHGTRVRGSGAWAATVDVILELGFPGEGDQIDGDKFPNIRKLSTLSRYEDLGPATFLNKESELVDPDVFKVDEGDAIADFIVDNIGAGGAAQADLLAIAQKLKFKVTQTTLGRRLRELQKQGILERQGGSPGGVGARYFLVTD